MPGICCDLLLDLELEVRLVGVDRAPFRRRRPWRCHPRRPYRRSRPRPSPSWTGRCRGARRGSSTGAVSTWKPFGGGGAMTTSFGGGGGLSLGGGGSSFFLSRRTRPFPPSASRALPWPRSVPYTAPAIRTAWMIPLKTRPPVVRCFFGFDSIRLLNMSAQTYLVRGRDSWLRDPTYFDVTREGTVYALRFGEVRISLRCREVRLRGARRSPLRPDRSTHPPCGRHAHRGPLQPGCPAQPFPAPGARSGEHGERHREDGPRPSRDCTVSVRRAPARSTD